MTGAGREGGFTLVEMLVALAVFAVAALALMRVNLFAVAQASAIDDSRLAALVAENDAALALTDPRLVVGQQRSIVTNAGRRFDVARRVSPTEDRRLLRVDIAAAQVGGRGRAVLTVVRKVTP